MIKPYVVEFKIGRSLKYWYGAEYGSNSGKLNATTVDQIARFASRDDAEKALRAVYGSLAEAKRHGAEVAAEPQCTSTITHRSFTTRCTLGAFHVYDELAMHSDGESKWSVME